MDWQIELLQRQLTRKKCDEAKQANLALIEKLTVEIQALSLTDKPVPLAGHARAMAAV